jgi:hypothetical protein
MLRSSIVLVFSFLMAQAAMADFTLSCNRPNQPSSYAVAFNGVFRAATGEFENVYIRVDQWQKAGLRGVYDPTYKPRTPYYAWFIRYRLHNADHSRAGFSLLLPKKIPRGSSFVSVLVGERSGYHGENEYDQMSCEKL